MKIRILTLFVLLNLALFPKLFSQNVSINSTGVLPDTSAMLDISSTTKGFLMPRMTTVQRDAIILPATGLAIFNTTLVAYQVNTGTTGTPVWSTLNSGPGSVSSVSVTSANGVSGTVATATTTPAITLTLGAITPASVAATGTVSGSNLSGTNTGDVTIGTANGLSLAGQALSLGTAGASTTGALTSTDWNTFNNKLTTIDTTNIGSFSQKVRSLFSSTAPVTYANGLIGITQANTSTNGYLSSTDWNTFNNKADTLNTWSTTGNSGTTAATNFIGTKDNKSFAIRTNNTQGFLLDSLGNVGIGTLPVFSATNSERLLVDAGTTSYNVISGKGNLNNYLQLNIKNTNSGTTASSDIVATNDAGTEANGLNFVDMGVNSSGNTSVGILGGANTGYLYSTGSDFSIGNATAAKNLLLFTGGTASANERMRIDGNGKVGIGLTAPTAILHLKAGTTAASTAPLKFTSGPLMTTAQAGAVEFLTDKFYGTIATGAARKEFTLNDIGLTAGWIPFATTNGRLTGLPAFTYVTNRLSPTYITLGAGTVAAGTAPLVFTAGLNLTAPLAGAVEFDGIHFYGTVGGIRYQLDQQAGTTYTGSNGITLSGTDFRNNLITGFAGGQTVIGGTGAGNSLTLSSTSHITKGNIIFGSSVYDEVNNRLGIGNAVPTEALDLTGNLKFSGALLPNNLPGAAGNVLISNGAGAAPTWSTAITGTNTGDVTIGTANGLSLTGQALSLATASTSTTGALTSTDWNTFNSKAGAFSSGNLTETGSGVLTINGGTGSVIGAGTTVQVKQAGTAQDGFLSSTDWNTFNGKQPQLNGTGFVKATGTTISYDNSTYLSANQNITLSGDISGTGTTAITTTLPTVNGNVGTWNNLTVNGKGLVTAGSNVSYLTANQSISFAPTGDVTGSTSGTTSLTPVLAIGANKVTLGQMAQVATGTFLGRTTAATGNVEAMTTAQAKTLLGIGGANSGDVTLAGQNYLTIAGQVITANAVDLSGTNATGTLAPARFPALTGDVTNTVGTVATTIGAGVVTNSKLATMPALTIKGNNTGAPASPLDLTVAAVNLILPVFNSTLNGLVPFSGGSAGKVLHGDGTWKDTASATNQWSITGNSGTSYLTNFIGTTDNKSFRFRTNNIQRMKIDSATGNVAIGQDTFDLVNPEKLVVNAGVTSSVNAFFAKGSINNYFQMNVKNLSNGANATSDIVATADNGTESTNYVDFGINGSGYTGSAIQTGVANDGYLISAGNDFYMVNSSANKSMLFLTGGTGVANERMRILANGRVGMGVQDPTAPFVVKDTMEIRRMGSLSQLLFTNTAGTGDFRIGGDGGDIYWQGGGGRGLQMGSYWTTILGGDRQTTVYPAFSNTPSGTGVLVLGQRDASVPFAIQSNSGTQSANLTEWRNSSGTAIGAVSKDGYLGLGSAAPTSPLYVSGTNPVTLLGVQLGSGTDSLLTIASGVVKKLPSSTFATGTNSWSTTGNAGTTSVTNFIGTTDNKSFKIKTNNAQAILVDSLGNMAVGSTPSFDATNPEKFVVNAGTTSSVNAIVGKGSINSYLQLNIQNQSAGIAASSDVVATANNGNETTNYIDLGINGGSNTSGVMGVMNDAYLYNVGQNLFVGTATPAKSLIFMTGGTDSAANGRMRIDGSGNVGIGNPAPTQKLDVTGNLKLTGALMPAGAAGNVGDFLISAGSGTSPVWFNATPFVSTMAWVLGGNSVASIQTLGTTNNFDLPFITNNTEKMRLSSTGKLGIGTTAPLATLDAVATNGILLRGTFGSGGVPAIAGAGTRLEWMPSKAAFRAGNISGTQWDSTNIGSYSTALGQNTTASGSNTTAIGTSTTASGTNSTAIGNFVSTNSLAGSTIIGDGNTTVTTNDVANQMKARFSGGYKFFTDVLGTDTAKGVLIAPTTGSVGIGGKTFDAVNPEKLLVDAGSGSYNVISGKGNNTGYLQLNIKNSNSGATASSDIVATNDAGTEANGLNFIDMGVNSSGNTSTGVLGGANTAYLYTTGSDLAIGNATSSKSVLFFTGGTASNERMRIDGSGNVGIGTANPASKLDVNGSISYAITTTAANITLTAAHYTVILTAGTPIVTFPAASTCTGRMYILVNNTGGACTSSSYIPYGGGTATVLSAGLGITVQSDGTNWYRVQ